MIRVYRGFSDAEYYKSSALQKLWKIEEAKGDSEAGNTQNDISAYYERYPHQTNWNAR